jgi:phage baseplate assembly protein W
MSEPVDITTIKEIFWSRKVGSIGEIVTGIDDIRQSHQIILRTLKGTVPYRPWFGSDLPDLLDEDYPDVIPRFTAETVRAIQINEERTVVKRSVIKPSITDHTKIKIEMEWTGKVEEDQNVNVSVVEI